MRERIASALNTQSFSLATSVGMRSSAYRISCRSLRARSGRARGGDEREESRDGTRRTIMPHFRPQFGPGIYPRLGGSYFLVGNRYSNPDVRRVMQRLTN